MIISNAQGIVTLGNPAARKIFAFGGKPLVAHPLRQLFSEDRDYVRFTKTASMPLPDTLPQGDLINFIKPDGEPFPGVAATADIVSSDGAHMGVLTVIRDVSREVARDQTLRQVQKMEALGQLTGGIAHDFNNLLTIITGNLELLELDLEGDEPLDMVRRAQGAANMGARLTDRLLMFARRRSLDAVLIDFNELLLGMMDLLRRSLGATVSIASSFDPNLWQVRSDISEMENAVLNLAINARDAMSSSGGELLIETSNVSVQKDQTKPPTGLQDGDYVHLSVSDTGHGIHADHLARVFEPFFTTKEAGRGTGLGLSGIYGFVTQSGGSIEICSEFGAGTRVDVYPPKAEVPKSGRIDDFASAESKAAKGEIVLVVEDQDAVRELTIQFYLLRSINVLLMS